MSSTTTKSSATRRPFRGSIVPGGGQYRRIINSGSRALIDTLPEVPGFLAADAALHDFGARYDAFAAGHRVVAETANDLADRFAAGENPGLDVFANIAETTLHSDEIVKLQTGLLREVGQRLWADRDHAISAGSKVIASGLTARLQELIESLRVLDVDVDDVDAGTAIKRGRVDQYDALLLAAAEYADLRVGSTDYLSSFNRGGERDYWTAATIANVLDIDVFWGVRAEGLIARNAATGELVRAGSVGALPPFDADNLVGVLAWLAEQSDAVVWVPTPNQFDHAYAELKAARGAATEAAQRDYRIRWSRGEDHLFQRVRNLEETEQTSQRFAIVRDDDPDADAENVWTITKPVNAYE